MKFLVFYPSLLKSYNLEESVYLSLLASHDTQNPYPLSSLFSKHNIKKLSYLDSQCHKFPPDELTYQVNKSLIDTVGLLSAYLYCSIRSWYKFYMTKRQKCLVNQKDFGLGVSGFERHTITNAVKRLAALEVNIDGKGNRALIEYQVIKSGQNKGSKLYVSRMVNLESAFEVKPTKLEPTKQEEVETRKPKETQPEKELEMPAPIPLKEEEEQEELQRLQKAAIIPPVINLDKAFEDYTNSEAEELLGRVIDYPNTMDNNELRKYSDKDPSGYYINNRKRPQILYDRKMFRANLIREYFERNNTIQYDFSQLNMIAK